MNITDSELIDILVEQLKGASYNFPIDLSIRPNSVAFASYKARLAEQKKELETEPTLRGRAR
jgi:hypothetical protein